VIEKYHEDDVVEGRVTKVVTFGAFVEILPGVEGLVHISELAQHHVENPREIVAQGQPVNVKIIEVDGERRRLSLSLKRVEETDEVQPRADGGESVHTAPRPTIDLSEEVFAEAPELEGDDAALESSNELSAAADEDAPPAEGVAADDAVAAEAAVEEAAAEDEPLDEAAAEDVATEDAAEPAADEADAAPAPEPEASVSEE
jgi:small subunit ribosomal protein S1